MPGLLLFDEVQCMLMFPSKVKQDEVVTRVLGRSINDTNQERAAGE